MKTLDHNYNFLKPINTNDLIRIGRNQDGGYVVNSKIIEKRVFILIFSFKNKYPNIANQIVWVLIINKTFATVVCVIETI